MNRYFNATRPPSVEHSGIPETSANLQHLEETLGANDGRSSIMEAVDGVCGYIMRPPISLERMAWDGAGEVRYYGWYSNVSRGRRRKAEAENGNSGGGDARVPSRAEKAESRDTRAMRRSWARLIKRIYEVDPSACPSCGGEMKIIAFISEHDVVDAILRHLANTIARSPRCLPGAATLPTTSRLHLHRGRLCKVCSWKRRPDGGPRLEACCLATRSTDRRFPPLRRAFGECEPIPGPE